LTVDGKVTEARFFLGKLTKTGPINEDSVHYLSAFLSASRSIMNQLLRDYARKYGLGFGEDEALDSRGFRARAQDKGDPTSLGFIDAYDRSIETLEKNEYYRVLALRRNINVKHGFHALVHNLNIMTQEAIDESESLRVRVEKDPPITIGPNAFHPVGPEPVAGSPRDFSFEDFPGEPVPHVCEVYLNAILDQIAKLHDGY